MGLVNLVPGRLLGGSGNDGVVAIGGDHQLHLPLPCGTHAGMSVHVSVRPENITLTGTAGKDAADLLPVRVVASTFLGNLADYQVEMADGTQLRVQAHPLTLYDVGQQIYARLDTSQCIVFT